MMATRSPSSTPAATSPLASARTSARNCALVTSTHRVPSRRANAACRGALQAVACRQVREVALGGHRDERWNGDVLHAASLGRTCSAIGTIPTGSPVRAAGRAGAALRHVPPWPHDTACTDRAGGHRRRRVHRGTPGPGRRRGGRPPQPRDLVAAPDPDEGPRPRGQGPALGGRRADRGQHGDLGRALPGRHDRPPLRARAAGRRRAAGRGAAARAALEGRGGAAQGHPRTAGL